MNKEPEFERILIKLSGEALMGNQGFGITPEMISAETFTSLPPKRPLGSRERGKTVTNVVEITIHSEKQFLGIIRVVDELEPVQLLGRDIEHSARSDVESEASMRALRAANAKASRYASAIDAELRLLSLREISVQPANQQTAKSSEELLKFGKLEYEVTLEARYKIIHEAPKKLAAP